MKRDVGRIKIAVEKIRIYIETETEKISRNFEKKNFHQFVAVKSCKL